MSTFLAFSGGLDSTYLLNRFIDKADKIYCINVNFSNCGTMDEIPEVILRRKIIRHYLKKGFEISEIFLPNEVKISGNFQSQQGMLSIALSKLLVSLNLDNICRVFNTVLLGWHKDDALENSFKQEDLTIQQYKDLLTSIVAPVNSIFGNRIVTFKAFTPCWDLNKVDMYATLPEEIKKLIYFSSLEISMDNKGSKLIKSIGRPRSKEIQMAKLGIHQNNDHPDYITAGDFSIGDVLTNFDPIFKIINKEFSLEGNELDKDKFKELLTSKVYYLSNHLRSQFFYDDNIDLGEYLRKEEVLDAIKTN